MHELVSINTDRINARFNYEMIFTYFFRTNSISKYWVPTGHHYGKVVFVTVSQICFPMYIEITKASIFNYIII